MTLLTFTLQGSRKVHNGRECVDSLEIYEHIRDIRDPEHPYTLEQLKVVNEEDIDVDDGQGHVR